MPISTANLTFTFSAQAATWAAAVMLLAGSNAWAASVCVTCEGPALSYSCSYAPAANGAPVPTSARALKYLCIQDIAQRYQHARCSVKHNQLGSCTGQVHMVSGGATPAPDARAEVTDGTAAKQERAGSQMPAARNKEPKTVVELARQTADQTQRQIDESGETVTRAIKSTWRCVATLFADC